MNSCILDVQVGQHRAETKYVIAECITDSTVYIPEKNNHGKYFVKSKERSKFTEHTYHHEKPYTVSFIFLSKYSYKTKQNMQQKHLIQK